MVLVCYPHNFVFIKTIKTGGTSAEMYFEPYCTGQDAQTFIKNARVGRPAVHSEHGIVGARIGENQRYSDDEPLWKNHMSAAQIKENVPADFWQRARKFTTVRNPFARAVSSFLFQRPGRYPAHDPSAARRMLNGFAKFILGGKFQSDHDLVHIDGKNVLDVGLRCEALKQDTIRAREWLGLPNLNLPHFYIRENKDAYLGLSVGQFFNNELADSVLKTDAWVFKTGRYSTDPNHA